MKSRKPTMNSWKKTQRYHKRSSRSNKSKTDVSSRHKETPLDGICSEPSVGRITRAMKQNKLSGTLPAIIKSSQVNIEDQDRRVQNPYDDTNTQPDKHLKIQEFSDEKRLNFCKPEAVYIEEDLSAAEESQAEVDRENLVDKNNCDPLNLTEAKPDMESCMKKSLRVNLGLDVGDGRWSKLSATQKAPPMNKPIKTKVFHPHEEEEILTYILEKARKNKMVEREEVLNMAIKFLKSSKRKHPFRNGIPGDKWFSFFRRRYNNKFLKLEAEQLSILERIGFTMKVLNTNTVKYGITMSSYKKCKRAKSATQHEPQDKPCCKLSARESTPECTQDEQKSNNDEDESEISQCDYTDFPDQQPDVKDFKYEKWLRLCKPESVYLEEELSAAKQNKLSATSPASFGSRQVKIENQDKREEHPCDYRSFQPDKPIKIEDFSYEKLLGLCKPESGYIKKESSTAEDSQAEDYPDPLKPTEAKPDIKFCMKRAKAFKMNLGEDLSDRKRPETVYIKELSATTRPKLKCPIFHPQEEEKILTYIMEKARKNEMVEREEVIDMAMKFLKSNKRKHPFRNGIPGDKWFSGFRRRYNNMFLKLEAEQLSILESIGFTWNTMYTCYHKSSARESTPECTEDERESNNYEDESETRLCDYIDLPDQQPKIEDFKDEKWLRLRKPLTIYINEPTSVAKKDKPTSAAKKIKHLNDPLEPTSVAKRKKHLNDPLEPTSAAKRKKRLHHPLEPAADPVAEQKRSCCVMKEWNAKFGKNSFCRGHDEDPDRWETTIPEGVKPFCIKGDDGYDRQSIVVPDKKLPPGWSKHTIIRKSLKKWDVIIMNEEGRKFRSFTELQNFFAEQKIPYPEDTFDFMTGMKNRIIRSQTDGKTKSLNLAQEKIQPNCKRKKIRTVKQRVKMIRSQTGGKTKSLNLAQEKIQSNCKRNKIRTVGQRVLMIRSQTGGKRKPKRTTRRKFQGRKVAVDVSRKAKRNMARQHLHNQTKDGKESIGTSELTVETYLSERQNPDGSYSCCGKAFRKEYLFQMHMKHYHPELVRSDDLAPKVTDLAEWRTAFSTAMQTLTRKSRCRYKKKPRRETESSISINPMLECENSEDTTQGIKTKWKNKPKILKGEKKKKSGPRSETESTEDNENKLIMKDEWENEGGSSETESASESRKYYEPMFNQYVWQNEGGSDTESAGESKIHMMLYYAETDHTYAKPGHVPSWMLWDETTMLHGDLLVEPGLSSETSNATETTNEIEPEIKEEAMVFKEEMEY